MNKVSPLPKILLPTTTKSVTIRKDQKVALVKKSDALLEKETNVTNINNDKSATSTIENFKDRTDPSYVGPGTWDVIHKKAFKSWSNDDQEQFCIFIREICSEFNCSVCRGHCSEYIEQHPPENLIGKQIKHNDKLLPLGIFAWTWKFHNAVNARLKKNIMKWDTAYDIYSTNEITSCSSKCAGAHLDDDKSREIIEVPVPAKPFKLIGRNNK